MRWSHSYLKCHGVLNGRAKSAPRPLHRSEPVCGGCGEPCVPWVEQDCCWIALAWVHIGCMYRAGLAPELLLSTPSPTNITSLNYNGGVGLLPTAPTLGSLAQPGTSPHLSPQPEEHSLACVAGHTVPPLCMRGIQR